jgi:hypothetical protein
VLHAASTVEWAKAVTPLLAALIAVGGAAFLTNRYERSRKREEFDRSTMEELAALYGQVFGVWKAWEAYRAAPGLDVDGEGPWELLTKAADAEGRLEALLVRIAADRPLTDTDIRMLAGLRQSFKAVRKAIRAQRTVGWTRSASSEYIALKTYTTYAAVLLASERRGQTPPAPNMAVDAFLQISNPEYEHNWQRYADELIAPVPAPEPGAR